MIKRGTLCYVVGDACGKGGLDRYAGSLVNVTEFGGSKSHTHPDCYCDWYHVVAQDGHKFGAHRCRLRPISDPDADVTERRDDLVTV